MARWSSLLIIVFLGSCTGEEVSWKSSYTAAECGALMDLDAILDRCGSGDDDRDMEMMREDITQCFPFSKPVRMEGIWVREFEFSAFFEGATDASTISSYDDATTNLSMSEVLRADFPTPEMDDLKASRVEIIGRKTLCALEFGTSGWGRHEVIVSEFLSDTPIRAPSR